MENKEHSGKFNLLMTYIFTAANFLFPMISFPYVTRTLGAEALGRVSFASSIANYFAAFATFGITSYAIRSCAKVKDDRNQFEQAAGEMFTANAFTSLLAAVIFFAAVFLVPSFRQQRFFLLLFGISMAVEFIGVGWYFTATEQFAYITARGLALKTLSLICVFLFLKDERDAWTYACILAFTPIVANVVNFWYAGKKLRIRLRPASGFYRHYGFTKWFFLQSVALTILSNMDVSMLGFLSTNREVGYYEVALKLKTLSSALVSSLGTVFLPRLSRAFSQNKMEEFRRTIGKSLRYNCVISIPITGFLMTGSNEIILLFCGSEYAFAAMILRAIMPAIILIGISTVTGIQVLLSINEEKGLFYALLTGSTLNLILNRIMIPHWSGVGAAIATVCCEAVILGIQLVYIRRRKVKLPGLNMLWKPVLGTLAASLVDAPILRIRALPLLSRIAASGICFCIVYIGILILFREEITTEIFQMIRRRLK